VKWLIENQINGDTTLAFGGANPRLGELNPLVNPDRAYVESVLGSSAAAPDNDALQSFDHLSIRTALEPAGPGGVPSNTGVQLGRLAL
jgi:hypothetical protein